MRAPVPSATTRRLAAAAVVGATLAVGACTPGGQPSREPVGEPDATGAPAVATLLDEHRTLREVTPDGVVVGTAVAGGGHFVDLGLDPFAEDAEYRELVAAEFGSVTPENQLKWELVHPEPDRYDFAAADAVVAAAERAGQEVRGHTLLWHSQNPAWLEEGDRTPDELRTLLHEHVTTVVGRYAGRIAQWDVANEVIGDDGRLRTQENVWLRELGPEVIGDAFRWAHEADPDALLFLNDYAVEGTGPKSDAYHVLVQDLLADGVPVHGFGVQGHLSTQQGFPRDVEQNLRRFADLGLAVAVTELDVRVPLPEGEPTAADLAVQADGYAQVVGACLAVEACRSITLWGFTDRYSWVPSFFADEGAATVTGEHYEIKPAYETVRDAVEAGR